MKLYELSEQIEDALQELVNQETGEISEEGEKQLDALFSSFDEKVLSTSKWILGVDTEADAIAARAKTLAVRAEVLRNKATRTLNYLESILHQRGLIPTSYKQGQSVLFADPEVEVKCSSSASAHGIEVLQTPPQYIKPIKPQPLDYNKAEIRKDLLAGTEVPGWELEWKRVIKIK